MILVYSDYQYRRCSALCLSHYELEKLSYKHSVQFNIISVSCIVSVFTYFIRFYAICSGVVLMAYNCFERQPDETQSRVTLLGPYWDYLRINIDNDNLATVFCFMMLFFPLISFQKKQIEIVSSPSAFVCGESVTAAVGVVAVLLLGQELTYYRSYFLHFSTCLPSQVLCSHKG